MYKIYLNDTQITLTNHTSKELFSDKSPEKLIGIYDGKIKTIFRYIDLAEKTNRYPEIILSYKDVDILWEDFKSVFKNITAAGGVVLNENEEILSMYRRSVWDLPKGKVDKGEEIMDAAVREVAEETGIIVDKNIMPLLSTYHIYTMKEKRILKRTEWFVMRKKSGVLSPQTEEDIEELAWLNPEELLSKQDIYKNIVDVVNCYLEGKR
ncbi:MAG TPA: NUDIX domain-containing protein [Saprospiraceae bacterium]|nr:NUDIX domain-containing protein [Saprospiraceae bacterium]